MTVVQALQASFLEADTGSDPGTMPIWPLNSACGTRSTATDNGPRAGAPPVSGPTRTACLRPGGRLASSSSACPGRRSTVGLSVVDAEVWRVHPARVEFTGGREQ